jgi:CubicO group peptidase (beta-lactamase class C family)
MSGITRRALLAQSLGATACLATPAAAQALPEPTPAERAAMEAAARDFMQMYAVPALSVAIGHAGEIIYRGAFGVADRESNEPLTPLHHFRIASVSKPVTSATIFTLIEQGRLRLADRIFGPGALLGIDFGRSPYNPGLTDITLEHLLTHTAGGWTNDGNDPMFRNLNMSHAELITWTLRNRSLDHPPGKSYAYSNFGYCVLGRVIEKVTGQSYAAFATEAVLKRCNIEDMSIAGNTLAERGPHEVKYYGQGENPYNMNVRRMDSHGGWRARPASLVQLAMHVSGFTPPPNILKPETIRVMTTTTAAGPDYAKGWAINKAGNWWHNGSLPGTSTILVRTHSGFCWAAFTNTSRRNSKLDGDLDKLIWDMVADVKSWRV